MLSRTADHLFWMARYIERAENTARMLNVNVETTLLPQSRESAELMWRGMLGISELQPQYEARYGAVTPANVLNFMVHDPLNPSSIAACLHSARENARAVRGALNTEVWETINTTWLELRKQLRERSIAADPARFCEWVKYRSHLWRGVKVGTMLKDEGFYFARIGTFLERADNTARILDVKFHALAELGQLDDARQGDAEIDHHLDFYHWAAILRSVSAFEIYRKVYSDVITPARVAELLMLRADMPRSLLHCINQVVGNMKQVSNRRSVETERRLGQLQAELHFSVIDDILQTGLHVYLTRFLERVNDLGNRVANDFLVPLAVN